MSTYEAGEFQPPRLTIAGRVFDRLWRLSEEPKTPPKWAVYLVVGGADDGEMYLPCLGRRARKHGHKEPWWDVPLNLRRPAHWPYAALTLLTGWFVYLESC